MRRTLTHIKIHQFVTFRLQLISTAADPVINVCFMGEAGFFSVSSVPLTKTPRSWSGLCSQSKVFPRIELLSAAADPSPVSNPRSESSVEILQFLSLYINLCSIFFSF